MKGKHMPNMPPKGHGPKMMDKDDRKKRGK